MPITGLFQQYALTVKPSRTYIGKPLVEANAISILYLRYVYYPDKKISIHLYRQLYSVGGNVCDSDYNKQRKCAYEVIKAACNEDIARVVAMYTDKVLPPSTLSITNCTVG